MFTCSEQISDQANMKYTHVTLDVGAAIKANHVQCNQSERWSKTITHSGMFMFLYTFFEQLDCIHLGVDSRN